MKLVVFGASGRTGKHFVNQALASGHRVTAFVRSREKLDLDHRHLNVIIGDALNADQVSQAIEGQQAVVSCLGANGLEETTVLSTMSQNIINGMKKHQVHRILYVASAGIDKEIPGIRGKIAMTMLKNVLEDHRRAVDLLKETKEINWTVARPMRLDNDEMKKEYRKTTEGIPKGGSRISRSDVAHFLLSSLENDAYLNESVGLAY